MVKIFAVTGPAGVGKSTLLNELKKHDIHVDDFKVSRSIQSILGHTNLTEAIETPEQMMEFQETVLEVKYQHDFRLKNGTKDVVLVERSFADIFSYAKLYTLNFIQRGLLDQLDGEDFINEFYEKCSAYQHIYAGVILIPPMKNIEFIEEANRGKAEEVMPSWDIMEEFLSTDNVLQIKHVDLNKRINQVLDFV